MVLQPQPRENREYKYHHFMDEATEAPSLSELTKVTQFMSWDLHSGF